MGLSLSALTINERESAGTVVAQLYGTAASYRSVEWVNGVGDADNGRFRLDPPSAAGGGVLARVVLIDPGLDQEAHPNLQLRVRAITSTGQQEEQSFTLTVRDLQDPVVTQSVGPLTVQSGPIGATLALQTLFDDPFTSGKLVRFDLSAALVQRLAPADAALRALLQRRPWIDVVLFDQAGDGAPAAVANFESYSSLGRYQNTLIHRSVPGFVIQGGGYGWADSGSLTRISSQPPVVNEYNPKRANIRGTVAMAKLGGNPDSATSEWFFSLADNVANLDAQNGGFTVFGRVRGAEDLRLMDLLAGVPVYNASGAFGAIPLLLDAASNAPVSEVNTVRFRDLQVFSLPELTYEVLTGSPLLEFELTDQMLRLRQAAAGVAAPQTVEVTVVATNLLGESVQQRFAVTLPAAARLTAEGRRIAVDAVAADPDGTLQPQRIQAEGGSDWIQLPADPTQAPVVVVARAQDTWHGPYGARNSQTGELLGLRGLGRYSFVIQHAASEHQGQPAPLTLELDPDRASALFLHDAYSMFHQGLAGTFQVDAQGRELVPRLASFDRIVMGGARGTSIVDLTSPDFRLGSMAVDAGTSAGARSVIWCGDADDTITAHGADTVIFGGGGKNLYRLASGVDVLQYLDGGEARDRVAVDAAFDPKLDRIELWSRTTRTQSTAKATLTQQANGTLLSWGGNQLLLEGLLPLSLADLQIVYR